MLVFTTLKQSFNLIETPQLLFEDRLIPAKCPPVTNSTYRPEYDWLFAYEREIARRLEPWLKRFRYELIGENGIICEALSNAYYHGHQKDTSLPIYVKGFLGKKGLLLQIQDQGKGFDVSKLYESYRRGKAYFLIAGNGIRHMINSMTFAIFYENNGTAFQLLYFFDKKIDDVFGQTDLDTCE